MTAKHSFYEFFAGGGMARAGLGERWECLFANDFDEVKAKAYTANWGGEHLVCRDVAELQTKDLPGRADLAWASFPCQDLSLAGDRRGLGHAATQESTRSGSFWAFSTLMLGLRQELRAPSLIVLENVYGTLTSRGGEDFRAICSALSAGGYRFGAVVIDAIHFLPQSRPRVFFIAARRDCKIPDGLTFGAPCDLWHPAALVAAHARILRDVERDWLWWNLPTPPKRSVGLADLIEHKPEGVAWHPRETTAKLLAMMSERHRSKVMEARAAKHPVIGGIYRRTRPDGETIRRQRAEVRFDGVAGCLRTPRGGSSRQTLLIVDGDEVRSRLLSPREAARLMGLSDSYLLPSRYNDAYHLAGDGVCVPVVRHLAVSLLEPMLMHMNQAAADQIAA